MGEVREALARSEALRGLQRHSALVEALIGLGSLVQGLADRRFEETGADTLDPLIDRLTTSLVDIAAAVLASWDSGFEAPGPTPSVQGEVPDVPVTLKLTEGYAFYALYPEAIGAAARLLTLDAPPRVIGIRSIGTSLAAIAAAAVGAPPPLTVRPVGHPFARTLQLDSALARHLLDGESHYVVVDEGPGLSGSSFAAVAGWLESEGVPRARIAFLPSHAGAPGGQASPETRARWETAQRPVVPFEAIAGPERLAGWIETLVGPLDAPLRDLSGGAWRELLHGDERRWPAAQPGSERRKYLAVAGGRRFLVKFAGLGQEGERRLARASALAAAGWIGEPQGLAHGFLVQAWIEGEPLARGIASVPLAEAVGRYLLDRVRLLDPPAAPGADAARLAEMARNNAREALGPEVAARLERHLVPPGPSDLVAIDGKLDRQEWIVTPEGLRKADALDHDRGHDLIGAQGIGWDVAGAILELGLAGRARARLLEVMAAGGAAIESRDLRFWAVAYLAFRMGAARLSADNLSWWPAEARRNELLFKRYSRLLSLFATE